MQFAADLALQGRINKLVLTHARHAAEGLVDDARLVVVAVAGQILDGDLGVRKGCTQFSLELGLGHWHRTGLPPVMTNGPETLNARLRG